MFKFDVKTIRVSWAQGLVCHASDSGMDSSVARTSALGVSWSGKGALVKSMNRGDRVEQGRAVERRSMLNVLRKQRRLGD